MSDNVDRLNGLGENIMQQENEIITINSCPICKKMHKYKLYVKRATALSMSPEITRSSSRKFTRLFTCPETRKDFQADVILESSEKEMIVSLEIIGTVEVNKNE